MDTNRECNQGQGMKNPDLDYSDFSFKDAEEFMIRLRQIAYWSEDAMPPDSEIINRLKPIAWIVNKAIEDNKDNKAKEAAWYAFELGKEYKKILKSLKHENEMM